jgi:hypothetical protein
MKNTFFTANAALFVHYVCPALWRKGYGVYRTHLLADRLRAPSARPRVIKKPLFVTNYSNPG